MTKERAPEKSYIVDTGAVELGAAKTHHFEKLELVIRLSYACATLSVVELHAVPVPAAVPPSVRSTLPPPHTLAGPPPPQVCGDAQVPQLATLRPVPQLSGLAIDPQFLPRRAQKSASLSGVQTPPPLTFVPSRHTPSPLAPLGNSNLTFALDDERETSVILTFPSGSANVWPTPSGASATVVVAGFMPRRKGLSLFVGAGATCKRPPFTAGSVDANVSNAPRGWRYST